MKLTIHVDDGLLREATVASNIVNQTELIRAALEALIAQSYEEQAAPPPSSGLEPIEEPTDDTLAPAETQAESPPEVEEAPSPPEDEVEEEALPEFVDDNTVIEGISPEPVIAATTESASCGSKKVTIDVALQAQKRLRMYSSTLMKSISGEFLRRIIKTSRSSSARHWSWSK